MITTRKSSFAIVLLLVMFGSCEKGNMGPIDSKNTPPFVHALTLTPDSIYIDDLVPTNGQYNVAVMVNARATDVDGSADLMTVLVDVMKPDGSLALGSVALHDSGVSPDSFLNDGVFSGRIVLELKRSEAGRFSLRVRAIDRFGAESNSLINQLRLGRRNSPPSISNLTAPDSVTRPLAGSILFSMTIASADSDGLSDISEVYFKSLNSSDPTAKFFLFDDGGTILHNNVPSGDRLAGDGIFTITVQLRSDADPGERLFSFQSQDTFGDTSSVLIHSLIVR